MGITNKKIIGQEEILKLKISTTIGLTREIIKEETSRRKSKRVMLLPPNRCTRLRNKVQLQSQFLIRR